MTVYKKAVQVWNSTVCITLWWSGHTKDKINRPWCLHPNTEAKCSFTYKFFDDHTHNAYCMEVSWKNTCMHTYQ